MLNFKNQAINDPNAFEVNTSIQRAMAKAISLHGLGLHIYRGEDINPDVVQPNTYRFKKGEKDEVMATVLEALSAGDEVAIKSCFADYDSPESKMAVWALFSSGERSAIKGMLNDA